MLSRHFGKGVSKMERNNGGKSLIALLMGAAIGAAGLYLSKKENRDKVKGKFDEMKSKGSDTVDELKQKGSEGLEKLQDKLAEGKNKAEQEIEEVREKMNQ